jgi:thioesterase domain-containing protein
MENTKQLDSPSIAKLSAMWERVLRRTSIGANENFFEIGGDPSRAIELFREIEKETGRSISPLLIYQAPTIASLSILLDAPKLPPFLEFVLLKAGTTQPPVFLMHGLGGNIMEFFDLTQNLDTSHPVYGLQARGTDGSAEPCRSIDEMAEGHVTSIRRLQPKGPYILVGYSLGGSVALEMARRFVEAGEKIALLVMIDSYPPLRYAPIAQQLRVYARRIFRYASSRATAGESPKAKSLGVPFTPAMKGVEQAAARALRDYQPRHYPGRIRFVKAATPLRFPDDPRRIWARFTDCFELDTVSGDHHELLTTYCEQLAGVISRYLRELPASESNTGSVST